MRVARLYNTQCNPILNNYAFIFIAKKCTQTHRCNVISYNVKIVTISAKCEY